MREKILQYIQTYRLRDAKIENAYFTPIFWVFSIIISIILWFAWPFIIFLISIRFSHNENTSQVVTYMGQLGDVFGGFSALAASLSLLILSISKFEQNIQEKNQNIIDRTPLLMDIHAAISTSDSWDAFYSIEYKKITYNNEFHNTELERNIDRLLYQLDLACLLYDRKVFNRRDMQYFDYKIHKVMSSAEIVAYISAIEKLKVYDNLSHLPNIQKYFNEQLRSRP